MPRNPEPRVGASVGTGYAEGPLLVENLMRLIACLISVLLFAAPARADVATSILPLQAWAEELLGEEVLVLVGPGQSPALFEPTGRQITQLAGAEQFFAIGVPFETALLPRLRRMFPELQIVELGRDLERMQWPEVHGHEEPHEGDPHVWLDPDLAVALIAEMAEALTHHGPEIPQRAAAMQERFRALDERLASKLVPLAGQELLAYHPALGYFAEAYGLRQGAVESGGSEPGARHLAAIASRMEGQSLRVLVVEPQFAPHRARALAGSLGLEVVVFDPLASDLVVELDAFADALLEAARPGGQP